MAKIDINIYTVSSIGFRSIGFSKNDTVTFVIALLANRWQLQVITSWSRNALLVCNTSVVVLFLSDSKLRHFLRTDIVVSWSCFDTLYVFVLRSTSKSTDHLFLVFHLFLSPTLLIAILFVALTMVLFLFASFMMILFVLFVHLLKFF